ncbi:MAG: NYN domain-containing protein [Halobacteriota archaeon]
MNVVLGLLWPFGGRRQAFLVDGPNLLRSELDFDLETAREVLGDVSVARVYLDHHAPPSLVEAVETNGMEVVVTSSDVDVKMAVDAALLASEGFDIAFGTRDADFKPALEAVNREGSRSTVVAVSDCFSSALESTADDVVLLD